MSRERKRGPYNKPRQSESKVLRQSWASRRRTQKPLPGWFELIESTSSVPMKAGGASELVAELFLISAATGNETIRAAAMELLLIGLGLPDWRAVLKREYGKLAQPYDVLRLVNTLDEIAAGAASDRQAAERTVAKFGGGASFDGQVTEVRNRLSRSRKGKEPDAGAIIRDLVELMTRFRGVPPPMDEMEAEVRARLDTLAKMRVSDICQD